MDTAKVIFYELDPVKAKAVKNQFNAYVTPSIKLFFVDYLDTNEPDQHIVDFFSGLDFDEKQINDLLAHRIWGFYYRGPMLH